MKDFVSVFLELIQISLGNRESFSRIPTDKEWFDLFLLSKKHSLSGILFEGFIKSLKESDKKPSVFYEWYGLLQQIILMNELQNKRLFELYNIFKTGGFRSCILKGQGTALYYTKPEIRQSGDIDIWVEGDRDKILEFVQNKHYTIGHVDIKHSDIKFFDDVPVEVHFLPSWMYCPLTNHKLQSFFGKESNRQFLNYDEKFGFVHTTIDFDLVYSIVHIYRHIFSEGIGLRQLMDYYHILQHSTTQQRQEAFAVLYRLNMSSFIGGIMWILCECFKMKQEYCLCEPNEKHGSFLLSEILEAGNFGQYDNRFRNVDQHQLFLHGIIQMKKNLRFLCNYPTEVLWAMPWKIWHYCWRKRKGYL